MAFDAYIHIEGIPGEALDSAHLDWIEILGYEYGVTQPTSATASSSGGASSGRASFSNFTIRKSLDKASTKLFEQCCMGKHVGTVKLDVCRAGGEKLVFLTIEMNKVMVSSVDYIGGGDQGIEAKAFSELPIEVITFDFASIKTIYTQQSRTNGQASGNVTGGWNRESNQPCA